MSSAYFAPLVILPAIITGPGRYRTRCGETVTIEVASQRHAFACRGRYPNAIEERWHRSGRLYATRPCANDIVEAVATCTAD
jgi:hypothetical protein